VFLVTITQYVPSCVAYMKPVRHLAVSEKNMLLARDPNLEHRYT